MEILDINKIGEIVHYEFANNVYLGGETLAVCVDYFADAGFEDSCAAIGREAIVEIDCVYYRGDVAGLAYDRRTGSLDVLLKLFGEEAWADE